MFLPQTPANQRLLLFRLRRELFQLQTQSRALTDPTTTTQSDAERQTAIQALRTGYLDLAPPATEDDFLPQAGLSDSDPSGDSLIAPVGVGERTQR